MKFWVVLVFGVSSFGEHAHGQASSPEWQAAYVKAKAALQKLSLSDKVSLVTGLGTFVGNCTGNTPPISSISFPGLCLEDSALGVRNTDGNSAFPAGINAAATFNRTLMKQRGMAMAQEFRGKGVNVQLGPFMNLMRAPASGRGWEGFGADPYLSGEGAYETVMGIQSQGVQAVAKHLINNEQEHSRTTSTSDVDDSNMSSIFIHMQANVAAVMCSYNMINSTYACENNVTLNGLLKNELAFQGYVMSDWYATHSTAAAANNGLDMTMPGDIFPGSIVSYFGTALQLAVTFGKVKQSRVDDMATRILAAWYLTGQDKDYPPVNFNSKDANSPINQHVNVQGNHADLIREIGAASTVLLMNKRDVLPLKGPDTIAVIGSGAGGNPNGANSCLDRSCDSGVLAMGWGSGTANYPYLITPLDAITNRSVLDGTIVSSSLSDSDLDAAARAAQGKAVAFVFLTADSGEDGYIVELNIGDRNNLNAWHGGDALVLKVAEVNNNTIVVMNAVGPVIVDKWIDHPNVTGLVWSGLPGQEAGNALVDILYGAYNPSARLPFTIAKSADDYPAAVDYSIHIPTLHIPYSEGLFIDYRHFDLANITPQFEFGFGISYTTFNYYGLSINGSATGRTPHGGYGASLDPSLHEKVITVSFTIQNSGGVAGHEVTYSSTLVPHTNPPNPNTPDGIITQIPQLYLSPPASANSPPSLLKGFDSVYLGPGESRTVALQLSRYDLSIWNTLTQQWEIPPGRTGVLVGASSRDVRLKGEIDN